MLYWSRPPGGDKASGLPHCSSSGEQWGSPAVIDGKHKRLPPAGVGGNCVSLFPGLPTVT